MKKKSLLIGLVMAGVVLAISAIVGSANAAVTPGTDMIPAMCDSC